jgi:hypothetical protein
MEPERGPIPGEAHQTTYPPLAGEPRAVVVLAVVALLLGAVFIGVWREPAASELD